MKMPTIKEDVKRFAEKHEAGLDLQINNEVLQLYSEKTSERKAV